MTIESAVYISDLNSANPGASDLKSEGDDHLRLIKTVTKATFPNVTGAVTPTHTVLNNLGTGILASTGAVDLLFKPNGATKFTMTSDGRFYGSALHNNAGAVTGAVNQYVGSGTYTPTLTSVTNITSSTSAVCQWIRVGNVVTVSGRIALTATAGGQTELGISLPIASTTATNTNIGGVGAIDTLGGVSPISWAILADTSNNRARLVTSVGGSFSSGVTFTFTYVVL